MLDSSKTTICVVNYKTEELTKLCLRSLRKYTENENYEVIVVDNNSNDASLDYLRGNKWIKLIERGPDQMDNGKGGNITGSLAHGTAIDSALAAADPNSKYFVALHSDTFIKKKGWLEFLKNQFISENIAVSGCGKLDLKPFWERKLKQYTDVKEWLRRLDKSRIKNRFYIRTICCCYCRDIFEKENISFASGIEDGYTVGKKLYYELMDRGYQSVPINEFKMAEYIDHLAHATMVLNDEFTTRKKTDRKYYKNIKKVFNRKIVQDILKDSTLDS